MRLACVRLLKQLYSRLKLCNSASRGMEDGFCLGVPSIDKSCPKEAERDGTERDRKNYGRANIGTDATSLRDNNDCCAAEPGSEGEYGDRVSQVGAHHTPPSKSLRRGGSAIQRIGGPSPTVSRRLASHAS